MVAIPKREKTIEIINDIKYGGIPKRGYLGMSGLGEPCWRKLWYGFHWVTFSNHSARTERIFNIGHLFESMAIEDLKKVGVDVFRVDEDGDRVELHGHKGEEQEGMIGFAGHVRGHNDGRVIGLPEMPNTECLLELKTMKDDKFKAVVKHGVEKSNPTYYGQMQRYMHGLDLKWAFFLSINKNTCEYYSEFVEYDYEFASELVRKERVIIMSDEPPEKLYASSNYNCNWCNHYGACHAGVIPEKNCRTCDNSDIEDDGKWSCTLNNKNITTEEQIKGCDDWKIGWGL